MMRRKPDLALNLGGTDALLRAVISVCLGQYRSCEAAYLAAPGDATLHRARVSLRRLRSALALFRPLTGPPPEVEDGLRRLSAVLGDARDLDVLLARTPPGAVHDRLATAQARAAAAAVAVLAAAPTRAVLTALAEWIVLHPPVPDGDARAFAARRLDRLRRKVKRSGSALTTGDAAACHQLRRRVKRLRHASELFGSLFHGAGRQARFQAALTPLQDALGALNDLAVGQALLARLAGGAGAAVVPGDGAQRAALLAQAGQAHVELLAAPRFWRRG